MSFAAILCAAFPAVASPAAAAEPPRVVATLAPFHALASGVMRGVGEPELLFRGSASPHGAALRPSQARALARAAVVFWGGGLLEPHLEKALAAKRDARVLALHRARGVRLLAAREAGVWTAREDAPQQAEPRHGGPEREAEPHGGHGEHGGLDPHYWLDPRNARAMALAMAGVLAAGDPENAAAYRSNAAALGRRLAALEKELAAQLTPLAGRPYLVFHDAYGYFERRFGLRPLGAVVADPARGPGARRVSRLRRLMREQRVVCLFSEPQFSPRLVPVLIGDTGVRHATLDPLGAALPPGGALYFSLLRNLGASLARCLTP